MSQSIHDVLGESQHRSVRHRGSERGAAAAARRRARRLSPRVGRGRASAWRGVDPGASGSGRRAADLSDRSWIGCTTWRPGLPRRTESTDSAAADQDGEVAPMQLGDFVLEREIGRGGMGVVYEARQLSLQRRVALKVLPFASVLDAKQIARFRNEAQAAAQLHHPHIVPVFAVGIERGVHYYAMQLVEGRPLDQVIEELREARRGSRRGARRAARSRTSRMRETRDTSLQANLRRNLPTCGSSRAMVRLTSRRSRSWVCRPPRPCMRPTSLALSTGISSLRICCSRAAASCGSPILGSARFRHDGTLDAFG